MLALFANGFEPVTNETPCRMVSHYEDLPPLIRVFAPPDHTHTLDDKFGCVIRLGCKVTTEGEVYLNGTLLNLSSVETIQPEVPLYIPPEGEPEVVATITVTTPNDDPGITEPASKKHKKKA